MFICKSNIASFASEQSGKNSVPTLPQTSALVTSVLLRQTDALFGI